MQSADTQKRPIIACAVTAAMQTTAAQLGSRSVVSYWMRLAPVVGGCPTPFKGT